jgi:hypothetical protein
MRTLGYALACLLITSVLHVRVAAFVTRGHGSVKAIGPDSTASSGKEIAPASRQTPAWMASPSGEMTPGSKYANPEAKVQDEMMQLMRDEMDEKQNKLVDTTGQHYKVTCDASAEKNERRSGHWTCTLERIVRAERNVRALPFLARGKSPTHGEGSKCGGTDESASCCAARPKYLQKNCIGRQSRNVVLRIDHSPTCEER